MIPERGQVYAHINGEVFVTVLSFDPETGVVRYTFEVPAQGHKSGPISNHMREFCNPRSDWEEKPNMSRLSDVWQ